MGNPDSPADKRAMRRRRTRLRSGKVIDGANRFLIECAIHDRSDEGARLRLANNIGLPDEIRLFDDEQRSLSPARIIWRKGQEIGIRFLPKEAARPVSEAELMALSRKFYAV